MPESPEKESESIKNDEDNASEYSFLDDDDFSLLLPPQTPNVMMTKEDLAVQNALGNVAGLAGLSQLLTTLRDGIPAGSSFDLRHDSRFTTHSTFPKYDKEDKLVGTKNYVAWRQRFDLDLRTNRLSSYILHELWNEDLLVDQKMQLDVTILRHLRATVSHDISNTLFRFKTAYHAFKHIQIYYGSKKLQELITLELRARNLYFADLYNAVRFVNEFGTMVDGYPELGTVFNEETLVAKFLVAIDSTDVYDHPYAIKSSCGATYF